MLRPRKKYTVFDLQQCKGKRCLTHIHVKSPEEAAAAEDRDDLFDEAVRFVVQSGQASTSMLQRRFRIGFSRAGRLVDIMEREGIVGPAEGSKPREILVPADYYTEVDSWPK